MKSVTFQIGTSVSSDLSFLMKELANFSFPDNRKACFLVFNPYAVSVAKEILRSYDPAKLKLVTFLTYSSFFQEYVRASSTSKSIHLISDLLMVPSVSGSTRERLSNDFSYFALAHFEKFSDIFDSFVSILPTDSTLAGSMEQASEPDVHTSLNALKTYFSNLSSIVEVRIGSNHSLQQYDLLMPLDFDTVDSWAISSID